MATKTITTCDMCGQETTQDIVILIRGSRMTSDALYAALRNIDHGGNYTVIRDLCEAHADKLEADLRI